MIIDDPFGSMEDAESEVMREKVWKWYSGTIYNRLQPGGAIVLIGHRLREDYLQGRLIEEMKAGGICRPVGDRAAAGPCRGAERA